MAAFAEFLEKRDTILPWIAEYSPYALVTADDPPIYMTYGEPPALGKEQRDPTHTSNFGVKLQEHCKANGVECELVYPGAPDVTHFVDSGIPFALGTDSRLQVLLQFLAEAIMLSATQIADVSAYVASVAGKPGQDAGQPAALRIRSLGQQGVGRTDHGPAERGAGERPHAGVGRAEAAGAAAAWSAPAPAAVLPELPASVTRAGIDGILELRLPEE